MESLRVGLIGLGTVGTGVARILTETSVWVTQRCGMPVHLKRIADLDQDRCRALNLTDVTVSSRAEDLIEDPEIQVIVELIGGIEPARTFLLKAMAQGKHVVTANKALLASHGMELFEEAARHGVEIGFEASVAGGVPIVRAIKEGLSGDRIQSIAGIINGTANYILSSMSDKRLEFSECLRDAQEKGYAEADPTLDVEGWDTVHKLAILVSLAWGAHIKTEDIFREGIQGITGSDVLYAEELGYRIKLLALARCDGGRLEARVHPTMIPADHMLASVGQSFNAVYLDCRNTGPVMFYGRGAGMMPTGSAVVSDLIKTARDQRLGLASMPSALGFYPGIPKGPELQRMEDRISRYYVRFSAVDRPGVLSKVSGVLGANGISISSVIQKGREKTGPVSIIMLTHDARERDLRKALAEIDQLETSLNKSFLLRIEDSFDPAGQGTI